MTHDPKPPSAPLTPDEAERLAAGFRPSWELDDAPFTGVGSLSATEMLALQGGGTLAEVRAKAEPVVVSRPPPPAVVAPEPETKVIVDDTVVTAPPPMAFPLLGEPIPVAHGPNGTLVLAAAAPAVPPQRSAPPAAPAPAMTPASPARHAAAEAPTRPPTVNLDEDTAVVRTPFGPKKTRIWMGVGAGGAVVLGLAIWALAQAGSGGPDEKATAAPSAATAEAKSAATAAGSAATVSAGWAPAPQATPAQVPTPTPAPLPTYSPPPRAAAAAPATPRAAVATTPAPAPKPHSKATTIVRDVPF